MYGCRQSEIQFKNIYNLFRFAIWLRLKIIGSIFHSSKITKPVSFNLLWKWQKQNTNDPCSRSHHICIENNLKKTKSTIYFSNRPQSKTNTKTNNIINIARSRNRQNKIITTNLTKLKYKNVNSKFKNETDNDLSKNVIIISSSRTIIRKW